MSIDDTRAAYDRFPLFELDRLVTGAQSRLEFIVTMHVLETHLPPAKANVRILDAGGGPGRYTIALAERGYRMTLLDLSPELHSIARKEVRALPESSRILIEGIVEASITDLSCLPDESFDVVLCLGGPLSHVVDPQLRGQALRELCRVTTPGGLIFASVIGRIGAFRSAVQWIDWFDGCFPDIAETGTSIIGHGRAPAYFFYPEDFRDLLEREQLEILRIYGCQRIGAHLDEDNLLALISDPVHWPMWKRELLASCDHPADVGVSNHILAVATKGTSGDSP
jgi:SAM-dependent methyltransferase